MQKSSIQYRLFDSSCLPFWEDQISPQHIFFAYIYVDEKEEDPWHFATYSSYTVLHDKVMFKRSKYKLTPNTYPQNTILLSIKQGA